MGNIIETIPPTVAEKVSGGVSASSGILTTILGVLGNNAAGIGAICTILTFVLYLYITLRRDGREQRAERREQEERE